MPYGDAHAIDCRWAPVGEVRVTVIDRSSPGLVLGGPQAADALGPPLHVLDDAAAARVTAELAAAGWVQKGCTWARLAAGTAERIDVVSASGLGLDRVPERVGPAEELWLRALAAPASGPPVPSVHRTAAHRLAAQDSGLWLRAHALAEATGRGERVAALQDAYETGLPLGGPRRGHTGVVALSGLDGAGKSTQAHLLATALDALGHDAAVVWSRVGVSTGLDRLAAPVKRVVGRPAAAATPDGPSGAAATGARRTARQPAVVDATWAVVVAAAESRDARRRVAQHAPAGRVLVRDRYVLDSVVHLADRYGGESLTWPAGALLRAQVPAPTVAFLLELPAAVAHARKPGEWRLEDLERHAAAYAARADELGVQRVDATLPPRELAAVLAERVWRALP